jgi:ASPIC/UnbV protein/VCBS repeat protein/type IX secretion system substrate protein
MKRIILIVLVLCMSSMSLSAQNVLFSQDNSQISGYYSNKQFLNWEETCLLRPNGPGYIDTIFVYLGGETPKKDTIWIVGDPVDGGYPPTLFCRYFSNYAGFIVDFTEAGFVALPVEQYNIRFDGLSGIGVQHLIKQNGPYFPVDNDGNVPRNSLINNVFTPNPNFSNLRGTLFSSTQGNYVIRASVRYDFPEGNGTKPPPPATLVDVTQEVGLTDDAGEPISSRVVTVTDWNQDGYDDLAIGARFYQNKGDGTFENVSQKMNIKGGSTVWADIDNDGYMDFFHVLGNGNDKLYFGIAEGNYTEETDATIVFNAPTRTPLFFDFNKDGLLDLFIAYARKTVDGKEVYFPDKLFKNLGNRKFEDVTTSAGVAVAEPSPFYDCYGANIVDYNNDNWPDVFVANYRNAPDRLFENNHDGTFTEVSAQVGVQGIPAQYAGYFGNDMGSDWADFDNDGDMDLAAGTLAHPDERAVIMTPSFICRNEGSASGFKFSEVGQQMGLAFKEMNSGILWVDLDDDGLQDLIHCHYAYDRFETTTIKRYSRIYMNSGAENDFRLVDKTWEFGPRVHGAWSPGMIDYDNDGDMDVIIASDRERLFLFRNDIENKGNYISYRLIGKPSAQVNYDALGATVKVYTGGQIYLRQLNCSVTGFTSQKTNELHFGLGLVESVNKVEITFSDGKLINIVDPEINRKYVIDYDHPTSVKDDIDNELYISELSPNPARGTSRLSYSNPNGEKLVFDLFNSNGELIKAIMASSEICQNKELVINTSDLVSGTYILKISSKSASITKNLVVIK